MIAFKKILEKTIIEASDKGVLDKIWDKLSTKALTEFIPPLFDEYVIKFVQKDSMRDIAEEFLTSQGFQIENLNEAVDEIIQTFANGNNDTVVYYYIKWTSATEFTCTQFLGAGNNSKFKRFMEISYQYEDSSNKGEACYKVVKAYDYSENKEINLTKETDKDIIQNLVYPLQLSNTVAYYMQHYSPELEYKSIKASPLTKTKNISNGNKGYRQSIVLKSKIKKYVLDYEKDLKTIRTYRKAKPCWYVRGYYQHFGKEKVLKYIPPRINYRKDVDRKITPDRGNLFKLEEN